MSISLKNIILPAFQHGLFFNIPNCGYRVFFGGKGTGKSTNIGGEEGVLKLLSDKWRNIMYVRLNDTDNSDSTVNYVTKAIYKYFGTPENVARYWWFRTQPNRIIYRPTGQMITFKGFNHPDNMNGTEAKVGYISDVYIEEASQIKNLSDYIMLDQSIRAPDGFPLQITFLLNPWDINCWIAQKLCIGKLKEDVNYMEANGFQEAYYPNLIPEGGFTKKGLYLCRTAVYCNPYLPTTYIDSARVMKTNCPLIYATNMCGLWGNTNGNTYVEFSRAKNVKPHNELIVREYADFCIGVDTGFSDGKGSYKTGDRVKSATVGELVALTSDYGKIITLDEWYWTNFNKPTNEVKTSLEVLEGIVLWIKSLLRKYLNQRLIMKGIVNVFVDNADANSLDVLNMYAKRNNLMNVRFTPCTKLTIASRVLYERTLMGFGDFIIADNCKELIREIEASQKGNQEWREGIDDHCITADEYGWCPFTAKMNAWKEFKQPS